MAAQVYWAVFYSSRWQIQIGPTADFNRAAIPSPIFFMCNTKTTFLYSDFNKVVVVAIDLMMMTTMMTMRAGGKEMDCYFHAVEPCHVQRCLARAPQLERIVVTTPTLSS